MKTLTNRACSEAGIRGSYSKVTETEEDADKSEEENLDDENQQQDPGVAAVAAAAAAAASSAINRGAEAVGLDDSPDAIMLAENIANATTSAAVDVVVEKVKEKVGGTGADALVEIALHAVGKTTQDQEEEEQKEEEV